MPGGLWYAVTIPHVKRRPGQSLMLRFSWFRAGRKNWRRLRIKGPARQFVYGAPDRELPVTPEAVFDVEPNSLVGVLLDTNYHCLRPEDLKRDVSITYYIEPYSPLQVLAMAAD